MVLDERVGIPEEDFGSVETTHQQDVMEARFEGLLRAWKLTELPNPPRIRRPSGIIGFARQGVQNVVLKLPTFRDDSYALAMAHFRGRGAVHLLNCDPDGAMVMERADPGTPLLDLVRDHRDDEAMAILCDVASLLHSRDVPRDRFTPVANEEPLFEQFCAVDMPRVPAQLVEHARKLFVELARSQTDHRLLHGDFHHENIILDKCRGWLAIDPLPVIGEPAFDLAAAFRNPTDQPPWTVSRAVVDRRARIACERLGLDRQRLLSWIFVDSVRLAIWSLNNNFDPDWSLATTDAVRPLLYH